MRREPSLERVKNRSDDEAWREFEARYGDLIIGYCRSRGLQLTDAEDIRQTIMLSLATALVGFEYDPKRGRFRYYLGRAVRNAMNGREIGCSHDDLGQARGLLRELAALREGDDAIHGLGEPSVNRDKIGG